MAKDENRIDIGKLRPEYEPLRSVLVALAEQFGIMPADLTNLSATSWSGEPFIRAELTVLIQHPERVKPERLRERASMLLTAANQLDGTSDTPPDAARFESQQERGGVPVRRLRACVERWPECAEGEYNPKCCRFPKSCSATVYDREQVTDADLEPEMVSVKVTTGRSFGRFAHRDPIAPLRIIGCPWPDSPCSGHRVGLGGVPLLTVPDDQAMHVAHRHAEFNQPCHEIACHVTGGRRCAYCGGAPCRITPLERAA